MNQRINQLENQTYNTESIQIQIIQMYPINPMILNQQTKHIILTHLILLILIPPMKNLIMQTLKVKFHFKVAKQKNQILKKEDLLKIKENAVVILIKKIK